jgi:hypothetical protein
MQAWRASSLLLAPGTAHKDASTAQVAGSVGKTGIPARSPLQDLLAVQPAAVIGLIAHLARTPLQEDIKAATERWLCLAKAFAPPEWVGTRRRTAKSSRATVKCDSGVPALWVQLHLSFHPRREHLPFRPRKLASARAQGLSRLAALCAPPSAWPSTTAVACWLVQFQTGGFRPFFCRCQHLRQDANYDHAECRCSPSTTCVCGGFCDRAEKE